MLMMAAMLPARGIATELVVLDGEGPLRATVSPQVPTVVLGKPRMRDAIAAVARHLQSRRPDLVLSSFGHVTAALAAIMAAMRPRPRLVAREPNLPSLSMAGGGINRWLRLACRLAYPRCDLVIASSHRMAAELEEDYHVLHERLLVLPNPVDEAHIRARAADTVDAPSCRRLFVASGRMVPQKGFDRLIAIWPQMRDDDILVLLGDGTERQRLEQQAASSGLSARVLFRGYEDNPWAWYARANALLVPSRFEGLPNAALEALACGTPVIATPESGGLAELAPAVPGNHLRIVAANDFPGAIESSASARGSLRPSLLPSQFSAEDIVAALADRLMALPV